MFNTYEVSSQITPSAGILFRTFKAVLACFVRLKSFPKGASTDRVFILKEEITWCFEGLITNDFG